MRRFISSLFAAALLAAHASANPSSPPSQIDSRPLIGVSLVRVLRDARALDFAVKAKIYPEEPDSMFVTLRGGGISVYDVSARDAPRLRSRWETDTDVEGQDRRGDLLVVVARSGALLTFDVSDPDRVRHLATAKLATDPGLVGTLIAKGMEIFAGGPFRALHTKLHRASDGRLYALVTATASGELIAVDVTDPERPTQVGALQTGVQFIEGIYVHREHAFVGGFGYSEVYRAIDVSNPREMSVVESLSDAAYRQMVSEMKPYHPDLLYVALWNDPGGLAVFDVSDPADFRPLGSLVRGDLARSNRVKLDGNLAFLPLEQEPGGFAAVDVTDPGSPELAALVRGIRGISKPYTLAVNRDHLYLFGSEEPAMAVFRIERGEPASAFSLWNLAPGDDEALVEGRASIYLDGDLVREVAQIDYEKFAPLAEGDPDAPVPVRNGFLLLADDGGEMGAPLRIGSVLFVNRAYDADEVASLGLPGPQGIPPPRAERLIPDPLRAR
jgi:hypothetical protein